VLVLRFNIGCMDWKDEADFCMDLSLFFHKIGNLSCPILLKPSIKVAACAIEMS